MKFTIGAILVTLMALPSHANDNIRFSIDLLAGVNSQNFEFDIEDNEDASGNSSTVGLRLSYRLFSDIGIEAMYHDFGESEDIGETEFFQLESSSYSFGTVGYVSLPLKKTQLIGRFGLARSEIEGIYNNESRSTEIQSDDFSIYGGVAIETQILSSIHIGAEVMRINTSIQGIGENQTQHIGAYLGFRF